MLLRRVFVIGVSMVAACSSGGGSAPAAGGGGAAAAAPSSRGGANLITEAEIKALGGQVDNAYDLVERLRPGMMRSRASTFGAMRSDGTQGGQSVNVVVYVDDVRMGEVTTMRNVTAMSVKEIRYHSATDATQRWGTGHGSGAIQIITKR
jgi:hypothetical protein